MAESFPAFLRTLERSIQPLEGLAGVAPPFRDEDDVEETTASDLAFVLRDLRRAAAGARALITSTNLPESSDDEGTQIIERTQLDDAAPADGAHTFYCQSGVRTTQLIFGMSLAGWDVRDLKNYDGSRVEWSHVASDEEIVAS